MLLRRYSIPELLIKQRATRATFVGPSGIRVPANFPDGMFIATVMRGEFDRHLRWAAEDAGARVVRGRVVSYEVKGSQLLIHYNGPDGNLRTTEADFLIGADGANSRIAKLTMGAPLPSVIGIQEEITLPPENIERLENSCILNFSNAVSPDYYGWLFPKGDRVSVGIGTHLENRAELDRLLGRMKEMHADVLEGGETVRRNGALIPAGQYPQHGFGRTMLVGDAGGFVLPACGEGIYFAMRSGELAAETIAAIGKERPDIVVARYTDLANAEFRPIFRYFSKIARITYRSATSREMFVRLARDRFMARKILSAWAEKHRVPTPFFKKLQVAAKVLMLRLEVATSVADQPGFGE